MNEALTKLPSDDEIRKAVFDINPDKAPGPDGMTSLFFQKYWGITEEVMRKTVKDFFQHSILDQTKPDEYLSHSKDRSS